MGTKFLEMNDSMAKLGNPDLAAKLLNPATAVAMGSVATLGTGTPTADVRAASAALNTANKASLDTKTANIVAAMQKSKDGPTPS